MFFQRRKQAASDVSDGLTTEQEAISNMGNIIIDESYLGTN